MCGVKIFLLFLSLTAVIDVEGLNIATCSLQTIKSINSEDVDILIVDGLAENESNTNIYACNGKTVLSKAKPESSECSNYVHSVKYRTFTLVIAPYALPPETTLSTPNVYTVKGNYIRVLTDVPSIANRRRLAEASGACKDLTLLWEPKYIINSNLTKEGDRLRFLFLSNIDGFDLVPSELVNHPTSNISSSVIWDQILRGFQEPHKQSLKAIYISTAEKCGDIQIVQSNNDSNTGCQVTFEKWISITTKNGIIVKEFECRQSRINPRDPFSEKQFVNLSTILSIPDSPELVHLYVTVWNPFTVQRSKFFTLEDHQKYKSLTIVLPHNDFVVSDVSKYKERAINPHLPLLTPVPSGNQHFVFASKDTWHRALIRDGLIHLSLVNSSSHKLANRLVELETDSFNCMSLFCVGLFIFLCVIGALGIWLIKPRLNSKNKL